MLTNNLFFLSFLYSTIYAHNIIEYYLSTCLICTYICSECFWTNPIKNSLIHIVDSRVAKTSIISFIIYTIYKTTYRSYYIVLFFIFLFARLSDYFSKDWCCPIHIFFHSVFHIFCFIGIFYAYL